MSPTIEAQVAGYHSASAGRLPEAVSATFAADRERLRALPPQPGRVAAGDVLAPFTLPNATGAPVSLDALLVDGPVVLVFYRGGWCPYCNIALRSYEQGLQGELGRFGARLVALSPQSPDASLSFAEKAELSFEVLSDAGSRVAHAAGIAFTPADDVLDVQRGLGLDLATDNAEGLLELPMPTVLIVGTGRQVRWVDVHPDYTTRTEVADILAALERTA